MPPKGSIAARLALKRVVSSTTPAQSPSPALPTQDASVTPSNKDSSADILESDTPDPPNLQPMLQNAPSTVKVVTQTRKTINQFLDRFDSLQKLILDMEYNSKNGSPCCLHGDRRVRCLDCIGYDLSCAECFISQHLCNPLHWAEVWDDSGGFFVRKDISQIRSLDKPSFAIQLGHNGAACPTAPSKSYKFNIADVNGVHATQIRYCHCTKDDAHVQLIRSRLFPCTVENPRSAFTFNVLKNQHFHCMQAKSSPYDYMIALRRLTDSVFFHNVSDMNKQLLRVSRVFSQLRLQRQSGQTHGIDRVLVHRRPKNTLVWCPSCPEVGMNMQPFWELTPMMYMHLNMAKRTADGNFKDKRFFGNSDPMDVAMNGGNGYNATDTDLHSFLRTAPNYPQEKAPCHIRAADSQNTKRSAACAVTGSIQIMCSHVMVASQTDLQIGERFANLYFAIARDIEREPMANHSDSLLGYLRSLSLDVIQSLSNGMSSLPPDVLSKFPFFTPRAQSYDAICRAIPHLPQSMQTYFPSIAHIAEFVIAIGPEVHLMGHIGDCMYQFASAYISCMARFVAETAEQYWAELNQLSALTCRYNAGHRHDTQDMAHNWWNFTKYVSEVSTRVRDIMHSEEQYVEHREEFFALCGLFSDRVAQWFDMPRYEQDPKRSVYQHHQRKVPSQKSVIDFLTSASNASQPQEVSSSDRILCMINDGVNIARLQRKVKAAVEYLNGNDSKPEGEQKIIREINDDRKKLLDDIIRFREAQTQLLPQVESVLQEVQRERPEDIPIYLPSFFYPEDSAVRLSLGFPVLSPEEHSIRKLFCTSTYRDAELQLREGACFDSLAMVQSNVKLRDYLLREKKLQATNSHDMQTRFQGKIQHSRRKLKLFMADYNADANALRALALDDVDRRFPILTDNDLYLKPTSARQHGASRNMDGFAMTGRIPSTSGQNKRKASEAGLGAGIEQDNPVDENNISLASSPPERLPFPGTQMAFRKSRLTITELSSRKVKGKDDSGSSNVDKLSKTKRQKGENSRTSGDSEASETNKQRESGWIWNMTERCKLSEVDLQDYLDETDRVRFFRAEAEMHRWLEARESNQAELYRCLKTFRRMSECWLSLANMSTAEGPGSVAFARKTAANYAALERQGTALIQQKEAEFTKRRATLQTDSVLERAAHNCDPADEEAEDDENKARSKKPLFPFRSGLLLDIVNLRDDMPMHVYMAKIREEEDLELSKHNPFALKGYHRYSKYKQAGTWQGHVVRSLASMVERESEL